MDHTRFKASHTAALYVSGDLDDRTQESFEMHLMSCRSCVDDVEIWRAMHGGMREDRRAAAADPVRRSAEAGPWRIAASLALIAVGSGAAGWYGRSFAAPSLTDDGVAVFTLPPLTRGYEDCDRLPVDAATEIVALRIPNAAAGRQLELTDAQGTPVAASSYSVRTQADGSWLLRMRARPLGGELLRLQTRAEGGATEPLGCLVIRGA